MEILKIALSLFLIANPIGNSPAIVALVKDFDFERQKKIMLREAIFALLLAFFFQYCGELFLNQLNIQKFSVSLCGGVLLMMAALNMIFSNHQDVKVSRLKKEPMFVPIATPLITGPGLLTIIMLFTQTESHMTISSAILIAWVGVTSVLVLAPYLQRMLGPSGMGALEQLMGMLLSMMAMQMIVDGTRHFIEAAKQ